MNFYLIIYFSLIKTILLIENSKTLKDGLFDIFYEFISGIDIREITKNLSKVDISFKLFEESKINF